MPDPAKQKAAAASHAARRIKKAVATGVSAQIKDALLAQTQQKQSPMTRVDLLMVRRYAEVNGSTLPMIGRALRIRTSLIVEAVKLETGLEWDVWQKNIQEVRDLQIEAAVIDKAKEGEIRAIDFYREQHGEKAVPKTENLREVSTEELTDRLKALLKPRGIDQALLSPTVILRDATPQEIEAFYEPTRVLSHPEPESDEKAITFAGTDLENGGRETKQEPPVEVTKPTDESVEIVQGPVTARPESGVPLTLGVRR